MVWRMLNWHGYPQPLVRGLGPHDSDKELETCVDSEVLLGLGLHRFTLQPFVATILKHAVYAASPF